MIEGLQVDSRPEVWIDGQFRVVHGSANEPADWVRARFWSLVTCRIGSGRVRNLDYYFQDKQELGKVKLGTRLGRIGRVGSG